MGKKKFIDKKKSATFQLLARDSSDPSFGNSPGADRVFVRVDNNPLPAADFISASDDHDNRNSVFDDAPGDDEGDDAGDFAFSSSTSSMPLGSHGFIGSAGTTPLPEEVRREILELGFPDDGYNYLIHLREIKNAGGGSAYYQNPKFRVEDITLDVKAYDASRLQISEVDGEPEPDSIYSVASKTTTVRVQKVVDPEVAALLDDSDLSRFGSDVEDLEEDFVVRANLHEDGDNVEEKAHICDGKNFEESMTNGNQNNAHELQVSSHTRVTYNLGSLGGVANGATGVGCADEKERARRLLDEQFDLFERQEYGTDDNDDDDDSYEHYGAEEDGSLAEKLKCCLNNDMMDDLEHNDDKYKVPADILKNKEGPKVEEEDCAADVIRRCKEYAEVYEVEEDGDNDVVLVEESSDESEVWDCETIVSTYSTLDNHPRKIDAPEVARKKKLAGTVSAAMSSSSQLISLRGKEKLPLDFLPGNKSTSAERVKGPSTARIEYKRKPHGLETKEEKKERKAAVKEERREARRMKKEMKDLYRSEAHRAQRVAAISGPASIHLL
ncbi:hypothetical protein HN51_059490 [Arachis hypogaea]|uniref:protein LTV1 homolog n=1 Tax=Arachis ipaensis TaxID=130454 RepID=UPI0007AFD157|nr:protein LTV1 homolog [Arachis ipaensis]XP_025680503.1 protein LTV1 homolog [Arachis hypogaea]